jgi:hypothetical protein
VVKMVRRLLILLYALFVGFGWAWMFAWPF